MLVAAEDASAGAVGLTVALVVSVVSLAWMVAVAMMCSQCCDESDPEDDIAYLEECSDQQLHGMSLPEIEKNDRRRLTIKRPILKSLRKVAKQQLVTDHPPPPMMEVEPVQPPSMTKMRTHSIVSFFASPDNSPDSGSGGDNNNTILGEDKGLGTLEVIINYDVELATLFVTCCRARDLISSDLTRLSDPYVRVSLEPDKKTRMATRVARRRLSAVWNETFKFEGFPIRKLLERVLTFRVQDWDRFSRDNVLGIIQLPISDIELSVWSGRSIFYLQPHAATKTFLGEIQVSLSYNPGMARLAVGTVRARRLKQMDFVGGSDPFVKVWCKYGDVKKEKKKTKMIRNSLNPVWNETLYFDIPHVILPDISVYLRVVDWDMFTRNDIIGDVVFSTKSLGKELDHWTKVLENTGEFFTEWHTLRAPVKKDDYSH